MKIENTQRNRKGDISNGVKKILIALGLGIVVFAPHALAQGFVPLAPIPGLTQGVAADSASLAQFFNNLYLYLIGFAAMLAIIEIIWGGLLYSTTDSIGNKEQGKEKIRMAIFGLILVLSPVLVFSIINPSILNLKINLDKIDLYVAPVIQATTTEGAGGTTATTTSGCLVAGTLLKTAVCPTQQAAQDFAAACPNGLGNVPFFTTEHKATCGTGNSGPFQFADTSTGWLATITGYSKYEPLESSGSAVLQFASACTTDGGTTCMSSIKTPCASLIISGGSVSCWNISLSCTNGNSGAGGCSSNPQFTIIK